jgi:hypothetical protein
MHQLLGCLCCWGFRLRVGVAGGITTEAAQQLDNQVHCSSYNWFAGFGWFLAHSASAACSSLFGTVTVRVQQLLGLLVAPNKKQRSS